MGGVTIKFALVVGLIRQVALLGSIRLASGRTPKSAMSTVSRLTRDGQTFGQHRRQIAIALRGNSSSVCGWRGQKVMSALSPKADMCSATRDVRFVPIANVGSAFSQTGRCVILPISNSLDHECFDAEICRRCASVDGAKRCGMGRRAHCRLSARSCFRYRRELSKSAPRCQSNRFGEEGDRGASARQCGRYCCGRVSISQVAEWGIARRMPRRWVKTCATFARAPATS
jgi:hypothetical protein